MMRKRLGLLMFFVCVVFPTVSPVHAAMKPVLSINLNWQSITLSNALDEKTELFDEASYNKTVSDFKSAFNRLAKNTNKTELAKDVSLLRHTALKIGPKARIIAELTAARIAAGLSISGKKLSEPAGNWRGNLLAACNIAAKIDETTHEQTALRAITIWRSVQSKDLSWASPPLDIKAQKTFFISKAIQERQALYDWSKGATLAALKRYRILSKDLGGSTEGGAIDLRIIELERELFKTSKQARRWQKTLVEFSEKYEDQQALGQGHEGLVQKISTTVANLHRNLINTLIIEASSPKADSSARSNAIKAIDVYVTTNISNNEKQRVRAASGEIYFAAKQHKSAAGVFAALASESEGAKAKNYWQKAIRSQTELANWPPTPPWTEIPKGNLESRKVLLDMFQKIENDSQKQWDSAAHVGLLFVALGQNQDAIKYWAERLATNTSGPHAQRAAGWIADTYIKQSQWGELETIGRLLAKAKVTAIGKSKSYRAVDLLGLALLEGGLESLKSGDYKPAIKKLGEFVDGWRRDSRHDEGMYSFAVALHGDQKYRQAIQVLEDYSKTHRRSAFRVDALKKGGDWALGLAWDEHAMYFLEAHTKEFPTDPEVVKSLNTLTDLYLGREIYDSAIRVMSTLLTRKDLSQDDKTETARRLLDTAERHASSEHAVRLAQKIQTTFGTNESLTALALSLRARIASERGQIGELTNIEKISSSLDQSQSSISEVFSEIKFLLAETISKKQFKDEFFSLGSKDPKSELERAFNVYSKIDQTYKAACVAVRTSWCGPALHRAARVGEKFVKAYDQIAIARTLDPKVVKSFFERKKSILETVENQSMESDEKSLEQAKSGATNPDWTSAILWQNGGDWSREKYTSENAEHYIQWRTR